MINPVPSFAIQFGRLLSQRLRDPNNTDAHRVTLGELAAANAMPVTLVFDNWSLRAGPALLAATEPGMLDLLGRMAAHGIRELSFEAGTDRAHLLGVVWLLSQEPKIGDGGANALSRLRLLGAKGVRFVPVVSGDAARRESASVQPANGTATATTNGNNVSTTPAVAPAPVVLEPETSAPLIAKLAAATTADQITTALAKMTKFGEQPDRDLEDVLPMVLALIETEKRLTDPEAKRVLAIGSKRIAKPSVFRAMAATFSKAPESHHHFIPVFAHFGDPAVDEVIEQLAHAESSKERRVLFDALVELKRGVPTLIYLLGDGRWYVVRNAAELLGEMKAAEAEPGLAWLLNHADQRVRQSATSALAKLETPGARAALRQAIRDESRDVRMHATMALSATKERGAVATILRALGDESDADVQRTLLAGLARIGTPEAVQHLVDVAGPSLGTLKKKSTPIRVAAVEALGDCKAPNAIAAVRSLTKDREPEVRDAATKALTPGRSVPALVEEGNRSW